MFARQRKARVLFGLSDIILAALSFAGSYQTRSVLHLHWVFYLTFDQKVLILGFSLSALVVTGLWLEIYEKLDAAHPRLILRDTARQCAYAGLCLVIFEYLLRLDLSRFFLGTFLAYTWTAMLLFRLTAGRVAGTLRREFARPHYVMVVGTGERAQRLGELLEASADYGIRLHGFLSDDAGFRRVPMVLEGKYPVKPIAELPALLRQHVIDEIIFAVESDRLSELEEYFLLCDEEGVRTRVAVDFFPHVNSTVSLERLGLIPLLTFSAAPYDEIRLLAKRVVDVVLAAAGLIVLAPFMLLVVLAIRLTSPGPAVFRQVRCGLNGRRFLFYKFRSMCENAEQLKATVAHLSTRQTAFKIPQDPRLTPVGRFLRKFSIDEWPQLWNVLRGDMSLVGPRPAVPGEVDQYQRWQRRRLRMRPGLT
ncbi:MAG: exopolysaccharide biosynthesis polyprenyl glycosylphosphotransferase, partial [Acidobacteriia bacterium]|nr:exopolysaccharide biosynthesis polyprenyl glycosylphosphotransferase [Terriglobia bacterium]